MTAENPKPPKGLAAEGRALWTSVAKDCDEQDLTLDSRDLAWLRHACKLADRVAQIEEALDGADLIVPGHAKQPVSNPLLGELRQTQALMAQTLGRLRLDVPEESGGLKAVGNRFRAAALTRHYGAS